MINIGILGSTRGTSLLSIIDAIQNERLNANIKLVISNKASAMILTRALKYQVPRYFVDPNGLSREQYDTQLSDLMREHCVDLIVLIGYMRLLSTDFVKHWQHKIINVHPSLLPNFAGKMDLAVHEAVIAARIQESGCTVHYVTEDLDEGPIILQKKCDVLADDSPETLKERVQQLEGDALVEAIHLIYQSREVTV